MLYYTIILEKPKFYIKDSNKYKSKTDSIPICGNGYKPRSSKFRLRANAETSHSVLVGLVVVIYVIGRSKKFLRRIVRSRKLLLMVPLYNTATTIPLPSTYTI
jgi:hypothetical protein